MIQGATFFSAGRQVAFFTVGLSVAAAALGIWLRRGAGHLDAHAAAFCLLSVMAITLTPLVFLERAKASCETGGLFYGPLVLIFTLSVALIHVWGWVGQALVGIAALLSAGDLIARRPWREHLSSVATFAIGLFFGLIVEVHIEGGRYLTVFTQDFLPVGGEAVNTDTYMHLALAQMIRHQGVVSTGVDDVIPITVYALVHALIGYLSSLLGDETARVADEVYRIIILPLMLGSVLSATVSLMGGKRRIAALAAVIGAAAVLYPLRTYFFSETYVIALFVFETMMVPFVAAIALQRVQAPLHRAVITAVGLAGIALANFGKPGVGTLAAGLFGLVAWVDAWRRPALSQRLLWMALAAVAVAAVFIPSFLAVSADIAFSLIKTEGARAYYSDLGALMRRFPVMNSIALIAAAGLLLPRRWGGHGAERYVLLFVLLVFVVAANLPGFSVLGYQWQYYILNVQMWLGLPILAALAGLILSRASAARKLWIAETALVVVLALICVVPSERLWTQYWPTMFAARDHLATAQNDSLAAERSTKLFNEIISYRNEFGDRLRVYVSPSSQDFWTWVKHCEARSMVIPAATGVPVIDGYPPLWTQCEAQVQFRGWQIIPKRESDDVKDDASLCQAAARRQSGVPAVYIINSLTQTSSNRLLQCGTDGHS